MTIPTPNPEPQIAFDAFSKEKLPPFAALTQLDRERRDKVVAERTRNAIDVTPKIVKRVALAQPNFDQLAAVIDCAFFLSSSSSTLPGLILPERFEESDIVALLERFKPFVPTLFAPDPPSSETLKEWLDPFTGKALANPFSEQTEDLTTATWLSKEMPDLAEALKLRADGGLSYQKFFELERDEKLRREAAAYDGNENPFDPNVEFKDTLSRAQAQNLVKMANPFLAERLQAEATDTLINPWLPPSNATRQSKIAARDPALGRLLRAAAKRQQFQLDDELAALRRAEEDIKKRTAQAQARRGLR